MSTPPGITVSGTGTLAGRTLFRLDRFRVAPGEWTCLLGPSGVGKTTVLRLLAGLDTGAAFEGSVRADDGLALAGRTALMAQADGLLPWLDVLGNVAIGARLRAERLDRDRARAMIDRVGLTEHLAKRPAALSGGMRQRVALARTLMEDRPVVLLDEPFSALDARTRAEMQELAAETLAGRTVLLVTHDPAEAARMGHAITVMLEGGQSTVAPPSTSPIRAYDAPEVFAFQSHLMAMIREAR